MIAISREHVGTTFGSIEDFAVTVSSYAESTNSKWPNVTIPHFPERARRLAKLTGLDAVTLAPLVHEEDKLGFEEYARERMYDF